MAEKKAKVLYYETLGAGEPMIMLHGNAQSHQIFREYAAYFSKDYRVILPDSRGHGKSQEYGIFAGTRFFTIEDMAEDVRLLMDTLKVDKAVLLGFSDGANIALELAARCPDRVRAVISVSGNALPRGLRAPVRFGIALWYGALTVTYKALRRLLPAPWRSRLFKGRQLNWLLLNSPRLTGEMLAAITAPVLLLAGTMDVIRIRHSRWMASCILNSRLVLIRHGTHLLFLRKKERYLPAICAFLRTLPDRG